MSRIPDNFYFPILYYDQLSIGTKRIALWDIILLTYI